MKWIYFFLILFYPCLCFAENVPQEPATTSSAETDNHPHGHMKDNDDLDHESDKEEKKKLFTPPKDIVEDLDSLSLGTIVVNLRDFEENPVVGLAVKLNILSGSVSKGSTHEEKIEKAGLGGIARFENLEVGSQFRYLIEVDKNGSRFLTEAFTLLERSGKSVIVHVFDNTSNIKNVLVGVQGFTFFQLKEDSFQVEQVFRFYNFSKIAWNADVPLVLDKSFKAFTPSDEGGQLAVEQKRDGYRIFGTVRPGVQEISFMYQISFSGSSSQSIFLDLPPNSAQMRVVTEASNQMNLDIPGFPAARFEKVASGKKILFSEQDAPNKEGLQPLTVNISGIPTIGKGRYFSLALMSIIILGSIVYTLFNRKEKDANKSWTEQYIEAREALVQELLFLENEHHKGRIGPKSYVALRTQLIDALAFILKKIEPNHYET